MKIHDTIPAHKFADCGGMLDTLADALRHPDSTTLTQLTAYAARLGLELCVSFRPVDVEEIEAAPPPEYEHAPEWLGRNTKLAGYIAELPRR